MNSSQRYMIIATSAVCAVAILLVSLPGKGQRVPPAPAAVPVLPIPPAPTPLRVPDTTPAPTAPPAPINDPVPPGKPILLSSVMTSKVAIALKSPEDLKIWDKAQPQVFINRVPQGYGNRDVMANLRGEGRIIVVPFDTPATLIEAGTDAARIEVTQGPDKGAVGWVDKDGYYEEGQTPRTLDNAMPKTQGGSWF